MAGLYMGNRDMMGSLGFGSNAMLAGPHPTTGRPRPHPPLPGEPMTYKPPAPPQPPPNVLPAQAIRPTGPAHGYDPSYLQNLATEIGGLFARPHGNLSFNPLGNLSSISPSSGMEGNAPLAGLPETWLQQALTGNAFSFLPKQAPVKPKKPVRGPRPGRGPRGPRGEE